LSAIALGIVLAYGAGSALAYDTTTVTQGGSGNTASASQIGNNAPDDGGAVITINQGGNSNTASVSQTGITSYGHGNVYEAGDSNAVAIAQTNDYRTGADVQDWGNNNVTTVTQTNVSGGAAGAYQNGSNSTASIYQHDGSSLSAMINAVSPWGGHGAYNTSAITQTGNDQNAT
ncbi:MAG TPA: hypothetical protein DIT28_06980, partial [Oxalobacteraceae bacterium]|nr:hypothetical protein [Oxalobacteraceae bacterium]